jgi:hypothetical protein
VASEVCQKQDGDEVMCEALLPFWALTASEITLVPIREVGLSGSACGTQICRDGRKSSILMAGIMDRAVIVKDDK